MSDDEDPLEAALSRSRAPSTFVESRPFTLSRERAVEKQREFALREPAQVVLELVQGAVFAGATAIAVETHPDRLMVAWVGGRSFEETELEDWLDHLFADRTNASMRPMVQLATGLNALLQRRPKKLTVETGNGERAFRLDLDGSGNGRIGEVDDALDATFVAASFRRNLWQRLTGSATTDELRLVEERCLYTPVPIYLNGRAPFGYRPTRHIEVFGADRQVHFDEGERRGVVATHLHPRATNGFRTVVGGVWVTTLPMPELRSESLLGVVCDDRLRKTADHADIVQDRRYVELLHALQPYATQVLTHRNPSYQPPVLPEVPNAPARAVGQDRIEARPLPDALPSLPGRRPIPVQRIDAHPGPLFVVTPMDRDTLSDRIGVGSFPFTVLVLDEGQLLTLSQRRPDMTLHRLVSTADVEFVRRVLDRDRQVREVRTHDGPDTVRLVRHLGGALPDAGTGLVGWPFLVRGPEGVEDAGVLHGDHLVRSMFGRPEIEALKAPVALPDVVLEVDRPYGGPLEARHLLAAVDVAWRIAVDVTDGGLQVLDDELLSRVLGSVAVAVDTPDGLELSLPSGWPEALADLPLLPGGPTARELLADVNAGRVRSVTPDELDRLAPLGRRLGVGHLAAEPLERCVLGVGRVGDRWVWLESPSMWNLSAISAYVGVYGHVGTPRVPEGWVALPSPGAPVVGWRRADGTSTLDLPEAQRLLRERLGRLLQGEEGWDRHVRPRLDPASLEALARRARAVLGCEQENAAVEGRTRAWVARRELAIGPLRGHLGLRHPFTPDAQLVVRTLQERYLVPIDPHHPPVHGELWTRGAVPDDLAEAVRLQALNLDEQLLAHLQHPLEPELQATVRAYATDRVLRAAGRGAVQGLADALARRVELMDQGQPWGSLRQWLDTDPEHRPALAVPPPHAPPDEEEQAVEARVQEALAGVAPQITLRVEAGGPFPVVGVDPGRSHAGHLVFAVNSEHPLVQHGLASPGRAREALLLELARLGCAWGRRIDGAVALGVAHARLMAQRLR